MLLTRKAIEKLINKYTEGEKLDLYAYCERKAKEISDKEMLDIALILKERSHITTLEVSDFSLTLEVVQAILSTKINHLRLTSCDIKAEAIVALAESGLEKLTLEACGLTDEQVSGLFSNPCLKELNLCCNQIEGSGLKDLASNHSLIYLNLSSTSLKSEFFQHIGKNQSLKIVYLDNDRVGNEGLKAISLNNSLEEIHLINCGITTLCALGSSVRKLFLGSNLINNIEQLLKCEPLEYLELGNNPISWEDRERLRAHYHDKEGYSVFCGRPVSTKRKVESTDKQEQPEEKMPSIEKRPKI